MATDQLKSICVFKQLDKSYSSGSYSVSLEFTSILRRLLKITMLWGSNPVENAPESASDSTSESTFGFPFWFRINLSVQLRASLYA
mgnify:CR=1